MPIGTRPDMKATTASTRMVSTIATGLTAEPYPQQPSGTAPRRVDEKENRPLFGHTPGSGR